MNAAQIWYGWAPRGREGTNREQLIAGSSGFERRTQELDRDLLPWLGYAPGDAIGWVPTQRVAIVFRRTDTGTDAAGRSGAFITHALLFPDGLPRDDLVALLDFRDWVVKTPEEPPPKLDPVRNGLGAQIPENASDDSTVRIAATVMSRLVAGEVATLNGVPRRDAWRAMSAIVRSLPRSYTPPSFVVGEPPPQVARFDVVARPDQPSAGQGDHDPLWPVAAEILLSSAEADVNLKASLAESAQELTFFLRLLGAWAQIDADVDAQGVDPTHSGLDEKAIAFIVADVRRLQHLAHRGHARLALRLAKQADDVRAREILVYATADELRELLTNAPDEFAADEVVDLLSNPRLSQAEAAELLDSWLREVDWRGMHKLSDSDAAWAVTTLGAASSARALASDLVRKLPHAAPAIVASEAPVERRAEAALVHPWKVGVTVLGQALQDKRFLAAYVHSLEQHREALQEIKRNLVFLPEETAIALVEAAVALPVESFSERARSELLNEIGADLRSPVAKRLRALGHDVPSAWGEQALQKFVQTVRGSRNLRSALPEPPEGLLELLTPEVAQLWAPLIERRERLDGSAIDAMFRSAGKIRSAHDAAIELACDTVVGHRASFDPDQPGKLDPVEVGRWLAAGPAGPNSWKDVAKALLRAPLRKSRRDPGAAALLAIQIVAGGIDRDPSAPGPGPAVKVGDLVEDSRCDWLEAFADSRLASDRARQWVQASVGTPLRAVPAPREPPPLPELHSPDSVAERYITDDAADDDAEDTDDDAPSRVRRALRWLWDGARSRHGRPRRALRRLRLAAPWRWPKRAWATIAAVALAFGVGWLVGGATSGTESGSGPEATSTQLDSTDRRDRDRTMREATVLAEAGYYEDAIVVAGRAGSGARRQMRRTVSELLARRALDAHAQGDQTRALSLARRAVEYARTRAARRALATARTPRRPSTAPQPPQGGRPAAP